VAAAALVIGLAAGVMVLRHRTTSDPGRPLPEVGTGSAAVVDENPVRSVPPVLAEPEAPVGPLTTDAGGTHDASADTRGRLAEERKTAPLSTATEPSAATAPDAAWVKPDWARPDDEQAGRPSEPESPIPAPPSGSAQPVP
jgi:hypothetical protein